MVARRGVGVVVGALVLAAAACSTFGAAQTTETPSPDAAVGGPDGESPAEASSAPDVDVDAAAPTNDAGADAAADADVDGARAPSNLLINGDFDTDCSGWSSIGAEIQFIEDGHSSPGSCQVCIDGTAAGTFMQLVDVMVPANGPLTGGIWFKAAPSASPVSGLTLEVSTTGPGKSASASTVDDTWRPLTVEATNGGIQSLSATFTISFGGGPSTECVVVDDATLFQQ